MDSAIRFDAELVRRYDINGPRYTSYPTAAQFHTAFDEAAYREAAQGTNGDPIPSPLSVYVHVPFCTSPCFYCGCTRVITRDRQKGAQYLARLIHEIELQSSLFDRDRQVEQLHLGGGTPTFLSPEQLGELMNALNQAFRLRLDDRREFSIEVDPRTVDRVIIRHLASLGFNRLSMGIQDFDPAVQIAVNREQSVADTLQLIGDARAAGFKSISVDLIYGLPRQTVAGFEKTLDLVMSAKPDRVAAYGYAHMPHMFKAQRQIRSDELPSADTKLELLRTTIERLTGNGYVYIGMDHFALPDDELTRALRAGTLQRNFQGYSTRADYDLIGLGMSAIGRLGNAYGQNFKTVTEYYRALDEGHLATWRGIRLDYEDLIRRDVIQRLMCQGRLDYAELSRRYDIEFRSIFQRELERMTELEADGLVRTSADGIEVLPAGRLLLRAVAMPFDAYLGQPLDSQPRYSRVI